MRGKRRPNPNTTLLMRYIIVYPRRTVHYYRLYIFSQFPLPLFLCSLRPPVIFHKRSFLLFTAGSRVARSLIPVALAGKQSSISVHSYLPIAPPPLPSSSALVHSRERSSIPSVRVSPSLFFFISLLPSASSTSPSACPKIKNRSPGSLLSFYYLWRDRWPFLLRLSPRVSSPSPSRATSLALKFSAAVAERH